MIEAQFRKNLVPRALYHLQALEEFFNEDITVAGLRQLCEVEREGHKLAEDYCNGIIDSDDHTKEEWRLERRVLKVLPKADHASLIYYNSDPRGYFLKIDYKWKGDHQVETDWGGYGIIAPDWLQEALLD